MLSDFEPYFYDNNVEELMLIIDDVKSIIYYRTIANFLFYPRNAESIKFDNCQDEIICSMLPSTLKELKLIDVKFDCLNLEKLPLLEVLEISNLVKEDEGVKISGLEKSKNLKKISIKSNFLSIPYEILKMPLEDICLYCPVKVKDEKIIVSKTLKRLSVSSLCKIDKRYDFEQCHELEYLELTIDESFLEDMISHIRRQKEEKIFGSISFFTDVWPYEKSTYFEKNSSKKSVTFRRSHPFKNLM